MVERRERLFYRYCALEAVDLIEVDRIDTEPSQTRFARLDDVLTRDAAHVGRVCHREMHLCGEHYLFHLRHLVERSAGHLFAHAHRVHVGGVEEVDAKVQGFLIEGARVDFVQDPRAPFWGAVGHASQTDPGDFEAATT